MRKPYLTSYKRHNSPGFEVLNFLIFLNYKNEVESNLKFFSFLHTLYMILCGQNFCIICLPHGLLNSQLYIFYTTDSMHCKIFIIKKLNWLELKITSLR